ncbi:MAG: NeuD/PglB/VioB family sugar acetyltransferase [Phycisphaerae bacterium]
MKCIVVGCGGHGRVVLDVLLTAAQHEVIGFVDSNAKLHGRWIDGRQILGDMSVIEKLRQERGLEAALVAIGDNGVRRSFADACEHAGLTLINAIHPSANIAHNATLGRNVVVCAGALICAHCQVGDSCILNTGSIVDHETMIGTACHICPGARLAGRVTVESGAFIGIGATVIQSIHVGRDAVVGAGAVVVNNVPPLTTVVGVPARPTEPIHAADDMAHWLTPETRQRYAAASDQPV